MEVTETSREYSSCTHALLDSRTLVVEDATLDERFANNPYVLGSPKIRFYAGSRLRDLDGHALGTLCVVDTKPRSLSTRLLEALDGLRRVVMAQIEQRETAARLAEALGNLRIIQGLVPICAYCKSIHTDEGSWNKLERYITEHSEAELSHSICPDCLAENQKKFMVYAEKPGE